MIKVASVIESAFKLKKVKSDKNLINILDKQAGFESMEKERSMASWLNNYSIFYAYLLNRNKFVSFLIANITNPNYYIQTSSSEINPKTKNKINNHDFSIKRVQNQYNFKIFI